MARKYANGHKVVQSYADGDIVRGRRRNTTVGQDLAYIAKEAPKVPRQTVKAGIDWADEKLFGGNARRTPKPIPGLNEEEYK